MSQHAAARPEAVSYPAADLDRRFYAFVIDRLLAWSAFAGAGYVTYRLVDDDQVGAGVGVAVGTVLLVSLVFAVLLGVAGVSPGKALVGLRVVRARDGRPVGIVVGLLRTLVLGIATLPTFGLGLATLAWTALADPSGRRRGAHDRWTQTVVVDVRPAPVVEDEEERPRQIVNLTAMRLMPASASQAPVVDAVPEGPMPPRREPRRAEPRPTPAPAPVPGPAPSAGQPSGPSAPAAPPTPPAPQPSPRPSPQPSPPAPSAPPPTPPSVPARTPTPVSTPVPDESTPVPVWRVSFDTGEAFRLEGMALIGRGPEARPGERVAHLVPLRSSDMSLSKTHAQVHVAPDGALVVMDRGSTNGSVIVRGGVSKSLSAGRPATLLAGDTVRFGDRSMTVSQDG